jgi:hypothetical protein
LRLTYQFSKGVGGFRRNIYGFHGDTCLTNPTSRRGS